MVNYQWNIYMADLNPIIGSEQAGKRPVVVVSDEAFNQSLPVVTILPITSYKEGRKIYPAEVFLSIDDSGLIKESIIMAHQIRTISKKRLSFLCGEINDELKRNDVRNSIRTHLDLVTY